MAKHRKHSKASTGRVGAATIALGIGVGLASVPWAANATNPAQNEAVSKNGVVVKQSGTAQAFTTPGQHSRAVATGDGAIADARNCTNCSASATGFHATAIAGGVSAGGGANNKATANGDLTHAEAGSLGTGDNNNTATATGLQSQAYAGYHGDHDNNNTATATNIGNNANITEAVAGSEGTGNNNNVATAVNSGNQGSFALAEAGSQGDHNTNNRATAGSQNNAPLTTAEAGVLANNSVGCTATALDGAEVSSSGHPCS